MTGTLAVETLVARTPRPPSMCEDGGRQVGAVVREEMKRVDERMEQEGKKLEIVVSTARRRRYFYKGSGDAQLHPSVGVVVTTA